MKMKMDWLAKIKTYLKFTIFNLNLSYFLSWLCVKLSRLSRIHCSLLWAAVVVAMFLVGSGFLPDFFVDSFPSEVESEGTLPVTDEAGKDGTQRVDNKDKLKEVGSGWVTSEFAAFIAWTLFTFVRVESATSPYQVLFDFVVLFFVGAGGFPEAFSDNATVGDNLEGSLSDKNTVNEGGDSSCATSKEQKTGTEPKSSDPVFWVCCGALALGLVVLTIAESVS